eukprot:NODE_613_length_5385_cov_1.452138.p6 type:complete len:105 gc:universal NODE_613_length_5385_cov_1.452138:622-308(-)
MLKSQINDAYSAWMHLKSMRIFVESVLRFGVPPEFVSCVMHCKDEKKVNKNLNELFNKLTNTREIKDKKLSNEQKLLIEQHMLSMNLDNTFEQYVFMSFNTLAK